MSSYSDGPCCLQTISRLIAGLYSLQNIMRFALLSHHVVFYEVKESQALVTVRESVWEGLQWRLHVISFVDNYERTYSPTGRSGTEPILTKINQHPSSYTWLKHSQYPESSQRTWLFTVPSQGNYYYAFILPVPIITKCKHMIHLISTHFIFQISIHLLDL